MDGNSIPLIAARKKRILKGQHNYIERRIQLLKIFNERLWKGQAGTVRFIRRKTRSKNDQCFITQIDSIGEYSYSGNIQRARSWVP